MFLHDTRLTVQMIKSRIGTTPYLVAGMLHAEFIFVGHEVGYTIRSQEGAIGFEHQQSALDGGHVYQSVVTLADITDETSIAANLYEHPCLWVIHEDALPHGTYPDKSVAGSHHFLHHAAHDHAILGRHAEACERVQSAMIDVEAEGAAKPYITVVLHKRDDNVVFKRHVLIHHVTIDPIVGTVEAVQAIGSAQPQKSVAVAKTAQHCVV